MLFTHIKISDHELEAIKITDGDDDYYDGDYDDNNDNYGDRKREDYIYVDESARVLPEK